MRKGIVAISIIAVVVVGLVVALQVGKKRAEAPSPATANQTDTPSGGDENEAQSAVARIVYTDAGFAKLEVESIEAGDTITVKNDSSQELEFASDDHPTHTKNQEFNIGSIAPGQEKSFIANTKGEWGFHNHNFPGHGGTITVE